MTKRTLIMLTFLIVCSTARAQNGTTNNTNCSHGTYIGGNTYNSPTCPTSMNDAIFSSLRLWIDENHDGVSQPNEIYTFPALGVNSISLAYKEDRRTDQYGNVFRYRTLVNPGGAPGTGRVAHDVFFVVQSGGGTTTAQSCPPTPRLLPEVKDGRLR